MILSKRPPSWLESVRKRLQAKAFGLVWIILVFLSQVQLSGAQNLVVDGTEGTNKHILYLELGGAGYYYTVNYERLLFGKNKFAGFARAGFEYIPIQGADRLIHFPIGANFTYGKRKHRAEAGFAALFRMDFDPGVGFGEGFYLTDPPTRIFLAPSVGYRFHARPNEWGNTFFLRVTFTPIIGLDVFDDRPYFLPHAGISIGRSWDNQNRKGKK